MTVLWYNRLVGQTNCTKCDRSYARRKINTEEKRTYINNTSETWINTTDDEQPNNFIKKYIHDIIRCPSNFVFQNYGQHALISFRDMRQNHHFNDQCRENSSSFVGSLTHLFAMRRRKIFICEMQIFFSLNHWISPPTTSLINLHLRCAHRSCYLMHLCTQYMYHRLLWIRPLHSTSEIKFENQIVKQNC